MENKPTKNYSNDSFLSVSGSDKSVCFIRFDISSVLGHSVDGATLRLFSILISDDENDSESSGVNSVNIEVMPRAGDWDEGSITWDNNIESTGSFQVASFSVQESPRRSETDKPQQLHEVDAKSSLSTTLLDEDRSGGKAFLTFKISSDSIGKVDFASREWDRGAAKPELVVTLAADTVTESVSVSEEFIQNCILIRSLNLILLLTYP